MISDHRIWLIGLCYPFWVAAAGQPCNLTGAERVGQGWLDAKPAPKGVLTYLVSRKQFDSTSMTREWTVNLQARNAALKGFTEYFRRISPPATESSVLSVKGMQTKEMQCNEGIFFSYEVNLANMSWEAPAVFSHSPKDELGVPGDMTPATDPSIGVSPSKQPLLTPMGMPKVVIED